MANDAASPSARARIAHHAFAAAICGASLLVVGCASTGMAPPSKTYGNHALADAVFNTRLANDSVRQLEALFTPARTRINVAQATPDAYGQALIALLREKGYAVMEAGAAPPPIATTATDRATESAASPAAPASFDLHYLIDRPGAGELYRLTLDIGQQSLSRAYLVTLDGTQAAGAWTRKE